MNYCDKFSRIEFVDMYKSKKDDTFRVFYYWLVDGELKGMKFKFRYVDYQPDERDVEFLRSLCNAEANALLDAKKRIMRPISLKIYSLADDPLCLPKEDESSDFLKMYVTTDVKIEIYQAMCSIIGTFE